MAYYDRRLLLPYLQDVCSVELLCQRLKREKDNAEDAYNNTRSRINYVNSLQPPDPPQLKKREFDIEVFLLVFLGVPFFAFLAWGALDMALDAKHPLFKTIWFVVTAALVAFIIAVICLALFGDVKENKKWNKKALASHDEAIKKYEKTKASITTLNKRKFENQKAFTQAEYRYNIALRLRNRVYDVNIIPSRYRSAHVACYLYDYFSTSRENDLDKILQTMLLDEINQKMDKVIGKLEEVLVNQRYSIALQERQNEEMARNHRAEMRSLATLAKNQELQSEYLQMIETNTAVSAFFSTADYLQTADYIRNRK